MTLLWLNVENADEAISAAAGQCVSAHAAGKRAMVVVPAFSHVAHAKKELSDHGASFDVRVESFLGWISDLWDLFGDGRRLVTGVERLAQCARLLQNDATLMSSGGMARLLADVVADVLPEALESEHVEGLSANERSLLELARAYSEGLVEKGCVELCVAVRLLPASAWEMYDVCALGFAQDELSPVQAFALSQAGARATRNTRMVARKGAVSRAAELDHLLATLYKPDHANPVAAAGSLRFAFPSGKGAELRALIDQIVSLAAEFPAGQIAVVSTQPKVLFDNLLHASELAQVTLRYAGSVSFAKTDAGRLLLQLTDAVGPFDGASANVRAAADLALNPLLGVKPSRAFALAREWRGNRMLTSAELSAELASKLPKAVRPVVEAVRARSLSRALAELTKFAASRTHLPEAYRAEQLSALAKASALAAEAEAHGVDVRLLLELLESTSGGVCLEASGPEGSSCVSLMSLEEAARLAPASYDAVLICEMNAAERPVRAEESARRTLLTKLGVPDESNSLARVRRIYYDAVSAARSTLVLERSLHAGDADPQYPATLFEETVDCYRGFEPDAATSQPESLVEPYAVTARLMSFVARASEADFVGSVVGARGQAAHFVDELPPAGSISNESASLIVLPRNAESAQLPGFDLSPSAIESYLECPHRWFAQRRLALDTPDEGFGGLERGTFVHSVLERFYLALKAAGHTRVTAENVQEARALLERVFDDCLAGQFAERPGRRYVPTTRWEEEQLASLRRKLAAYVEAEPAFLPGFAPAYFELDFGVDSPCPYAGHRLRGTIDRIDVDAQGNAVVIDYKTSLSKDYDAHEKDPDFSEGLPLPRKMQTLIYAKVARDGVGIDFAGGPAIKRVVGALYVNPLKLQVRGAYDACVVGPEVIPGITPARASVPFGRIGSFNELLDEAERVVARRLEGLAAGDIRPNPYSKDVCSYCPSMLCERRLS